MVTLEEFVVSRLDGRCYCDVTDTELIINYSGEYPIPGPLLDLSDDGDIQLYGELMGNRVLKLEIDIMSGAKVNIYANYNDY